MHTEKPEIEQKTILAIDNVNTFIKGEYPKELDRVLSYYVQGYLFSPLYNKCPVRNCQQSISRKTGRCKVCNTKRAWDGRKRFLTVRNNLVFFPTGCLPEVVSCFREMGYSYKINDTRVCPTTVDASQIRNLKLIDPNDPTKFRIPYNHQFEAIEACIKYTRGLVGVPTRGGKSSIIAAINKLINIPSVVLIGSVSVGKQLQDEIGKLLGTEVGFIGDGEYNPKFITICLIQTMTNEIVSKNPEVLKFVNGIQAMFSDEVHHIGDNLWYDLTKKFTNAFYRFGFSGTLEMRTSNDDLLTRGSTGRIIYEIDEQTLIDLGIISRPIIHFYTINEPDDIKDFSYKNAYKFGIVENLQLNKLTAKITYNLHKKYKILILLEHQNHIQNLIEQFEHLKLDNYKIITGLDKKQDYRKQIISEFSNENLQVLIATKLFDEGITFPVIDVLIRLGCMKTKIKSKQQIGRVQGVRDDRENIVHAIDFAINTNKYLADHSMERFNMYHSLGYEIRFEEEPLMEL